MLACPRCGTLNPERAKFCQECGLPLAGEVAARREARRVVTILFCDVAMPGDAAEQLDPETVRRMVGRWFDDMRGVLERHGGTVEKFVGDAVMAVFGIPEIHEDDALRAARAAEEMAARTATLNEEFEKVWGLRVQPRIGINTGEVVAGDTAAGQNMVTGDAVNVAARLQQAAAAGEVLLGDTTHELVRDAVRVEAVPPLALKGKGTPVDAFRLLDVVPGALGHARRLDVPLVGREQELQLLDWAFKRTVSEQRCQLFTVLGPAGAGKSRFAAEAVSRLASEATVLRGECAPYGDQTSFTIAGELLQQATGIGRGDDAASAEEKLRDLLGEQEHPDTIRLLLPLLGAGDVTGGVEEIVWAVRKLLEAVARARPLVVLIDDLHWAEPTFLDAIEHVVDWAGSVAILIVCVGRPELLDLRPHWGGGKLNATTVHLEPLSDEETERLLHNLAGDRLAPEVVDRLTASAEGNPLFAEEMLDMLLDRELLKKVDGTLVPTVDLTDVDVPPSIQALVAARIGRLDPAELRVLERASVPGRIFDQAAVVELSPSEERATVPTHLRSLARRDLVRPAGSATGGESFQFRHVLIREAAYDAVPKRERAELHECFARWLDARPTRTVGQDELVGFHLESAYRYRQELGPVDEQERELARRASALLAAAGRRLMSRDDAMQGASLLERAAALEPETGLAQLLHDLYLARVATGELDRAFDTLQRAKLALTDDERLNAHLVLSDLELRLHTDADVPLPDAELDVERALGVFERLGDEQGQARGWLLLGALVYWTRCQAGASEKAVLRATEHAHAAGDERQVATCLGFLASVLLWGPTPVADAISRAEDVIDAAVSRYVEARWIRVLAGLRAMQGDFDLARQLVRRAMGLFEDLGAALPVAGSFQVLGVIESLAGNTDAAEAAHRESYERYAALGATTFMSTACAMLALQVAEQGHIDDAAVLSRMSEVSSAVDDIDSHMTWRVVRAKVMAARGRTEEAVALAREAVLVGEATDLCSYADVLYEAARVMVAGGEPAEGVPFVERSVTLHERKGNVVGARRSRSLLATMTG